MTDNITLAGKIVEKKLLIQQQLKNKIAAHNETVNKKQDLFNEIKQLQGALQILEELDYVSDSSSDSKPT